MSLAANSHRAHNFSAGPGALPLEVLEQVQAELLDYQGTGVSVMEMSHRSAPFEEILNTAVADLRELMGLDEEWEVLFLQGGASHQFANIPMAFLNQGTAQYVVTGAWGEKAVESARIVSDVHGGRIDIAWTGKLEGFKTVPKREELGINEFVRYAHITPNETIQGVEFHHELDCRAPLIADMSSNILSRPMDLTQYSMIYAGAQKNMGPAGVTLVLIKKDLLKRTGDSLPPMFDYRVHAKNGSLYNTPPTFAIYVCGKVFQWLKGIGGLPEMERRNRRKAGRLYKVIDESNGFYKGHADRLSRSLMNVTFTLPSEELTKTFLAEAKAHGLMELKGHRSLGGCRASIYNAVPESSVEVLAAFMVSFASRNHA